MLIPIGLTSALGDALPIKADIALTGRSLLTAAAYGLLVSLLFSLWPLGRAEQVPTAVLFRDEVAPEPVLPRLAHHCHDGCRSGRCWPPLPSFPPRQGCWPSIPASA